MPHSVSPEASPTASLEEDSTLPDAPTADFDGDTIPGGTDPDSAVKEPLKDEVKLEDLFDDDEEEDEEFPSSSAQDAKVESSPPAAPL